MGMYGFNFLIFKLSAAKVINFKRRMYHTGGVTLTNCKTYNHLFIIPLCVFYHAVTSKVKYGTNNYCDDNDQCDAGFYLVF